jgi:hypothetical protein
MGGGADPRKDPASFEHVDDLGELREIKRECVQREQ